MELRFTSIEEVQEFVKRIKGSRGGKGEKDEGEAQTGNAPPPLQPPAGGAMQGFNPGGFAAPGAGAGQEGGGFPVAGAQTGPAPEVLALVQRITAKLDAAIASGQNAEQALVWFRGECVKGGVDANNYTLDQIKQIALPKLPVPALEGIAKLMAA